MSGYRDISASERYNEAKARFKTRPEETNACYKEHTLSLACLDEFYYSREKCDHYFQNYKNCKAFWSFVYSERRRKGITPYLPPVEERVKVKEEYLPYFKPP
ncbi:Coiled-coil-helix-coiled-coil-helix domain-containing protein 7, partial [Stegodyphus mimosarum]